MTDLKFIEIAKLVLFSEIQSTLALSIIVKEIVCSTKNELTIPKTKINHPTRSAISK